MTNSYPRLVMLEYLPDSTYRTVIFDRNEYAQEEQSILVLHLGDHDPSGIDMTRDNDDRLNMFVRFHADEEGRDWPDLEIRRIALNMDQVTRYNPPPNPAKFTDSRATGYVAKFGTSSWELDALDPKVIAQLLRDQFDMALDDEKWEEAIKREQLARNGLSDLADTWKDPE